jgi:hypothetical protein
MRSAIALLALLLLAAPAGAADQLVPGDAAAPVLKDVFAADVGLVAIVAPPFAPQYAVGLRVKNGDYRVFSLMAGTQVWPRLLKGQPVGDGSQYCEAPVASDLGARIDAIWKAMVRRAGADADPGAGADMARYDFATVVDGRLAVGSATDRDGDSRVGMLESIAVAMQLFCQSPGAFERERFVSRVDALAVQLQLAPMERKP